MLAGTGFFASHTPAGQDHLHVSTRPGPQCDTRPFPTPQSLSYH